MDARTNATMGFKIYLELSEEEARALEAIVGYGIKPFLEIFYKSLGKHYLKPHEKGAESLFKTIQNVRSQLSRIDKTREVFLLHTPTKSSL